MADYPTFEHDVLVIGAGGAGLRAAIEASAAGVSVGLICKSLLGKAHTVMAEGGMAAALANVDDRDNWKVHFSDTMRGGQYINNWRMAERADCARSGTPKPLTLASGFIIGPTAIHRRLRSWRRLSQAREVPFRRCRTRP